VAEIERARQYFAVMESGAVMYNGETLQTDLVCGSETSERRAVRKGGELNMLLQLSACCLGRCMEWYGDR
jgi:hypothetical protein